MSNNPPDVILDLTAEEATFLLRNCQSNIQYGLQSLQAADIEGASNEFFVRMRDLIEQFSNIRDKLRNSGAKDAD